MNENSVIFIGLDTSKLKISVAVADGGRNGEVRFFGDISSEPASVAVDGQEAFQAWSQASLLL
jgi:transposase